jgi:hypothetical protein
MSSQPASTSESNDNFTSRLFEGEKSLAEQDIYVSLTYDELNAKSVMDRVKSPKAGAVVLFAGKSSTIPCCNT